MRKNLAFIWILVLLFLANLANAATIHGAVYDLSLNKIDNARVEINSIPKQFIVAQNGTYSFNVPNGDYTIKAQQIQRKTIIASVQENITIRQTGSYVLDLILFPDVEEGVEEISIDVNNIAGLNNNNFLAIALIVILLIAVLAYFIFKKTKQKKGIITEYKAEKNKDNNGNTTGSNIGKGKEIDIILGILKKEGGRATQKEIRKEIPFSEAKISLMIAELEHKGIVEKVKKGRGNIIILKK